MLPTEGIGSQLRTQRLSYYFHMWEEEGEEEEEEEEEEEVVKVKMSYRLELSSCPCSFSSPNYLARASARSKL